MTALPPAPRRPVGGNRPACRRARPEGSTAAEQEMLLKQEGLLAKMGLLVTATYAAQGLARARGLSPVAGVTGRLPEKE